MFVVFVVTVRQPALYNVTQLSSELRSVQISSSTSKAAKQLRFAECETW